MDDNARMPDASTNFKLNGLASGPASTPSPFDPAALRIRSATVPSIGVKKLITSVPVAKPRKQAFVRVNPEESTRLEAAIIELKEDGKVYLVVPELHEALADEITVVTLFTVVDTGGNLSLWPAKIPREGGRANDWHASALAAAQEAMKAWVRVEADMKAGHYIVFCAEGQLPGPAWPDLTLHQMLEIAFRDRLIDSLDHPVVAKLKGRA